MSVRQMIVFGDSLSDAGRRFNAPASFDFDGIGTFPFTKLFEEPDSDVSAGLRTNRQIGQVRSDNHFQN